ncbi:hypothetical protein U1Q18_020357 [Sarracenia purpurea var. burkii]
MSKPISKTLRPLGCNQTRDMVPWRPCRFTGLVVKALPIRLLEQASSLALVSSAWRMTSFSSSMVILNYLKRKAISSRGESRRPLPPFQNVEAV